MITKEFGKHVGVCDVCDEVTPRFVKWDEVRAYFTANGWKTYRNKETGEWENLCPECKQLNT